MTAILRQIRDLPRQRLAAPFWLVVPLWSGVPRIARSSTSQRALMTSSGQPRHARLLRLAPASSQGRADLDQHGRQPAQIRMEGRRQRGELQQRWAALTIIDLAQEDVGCPE